MLRNLRHRLTYANVTATLALFLALGGGAAWAANEWGSANIRDNTLESRDVKDNSGVTHRDVVDDTVAGGGLVGADLRTNTVRGLDILESTLGKVPDADKLDGRDSAAFLPVSKYKLEDVTTGNDAGTARKAWGVFCDAGDSLLSGGLADLDAGTEIDSVEPTPDQDAYVARWRNDATEDTVRVVAMCADVNPGSPAR